MEVLCPNVSRKWMVDRENLKDSRGTKRQWRAALSLSFFDKKSHFVNKLTLVFSREGIWNTLSLKALDFAINDTIHKCKNYIYFWPILRCKIKVIWKLSLEALGLNLGVTSAQVRKDPKSNNTNSFWRRDETQWYYTLLGPMWGVSKQTMMQMTLL